MPMNPEVKAKWLAALRSGEFQQTKQVLKSAEGYCCLGVLCELYRREVGGEWLPPTRDVSAAADNAEHKFRTVGLPPSAVWKWAELSPRVQLVLGPEPEDDDDPSNAYELVDLNDGTSSIAAQPFSVIADLIEEQL